MKSNPKAERKIKVEITFIGPVAQHNLLCWLCEKNPAVYDMNPNWVFRPCWVCQKRIGRGGKIVFKNRLGWLIRRFV